MNLELVREAEAVPSTEDLERRLAEAVCVPAGPALPPRPEGGALQALVDAFGPEGDGACRGADGAPSEFEGRRVACVRAKPQAVALDERVRAAARLPVDAVVLDRPDAWFAAGPRGAGFCAACGDRLNQALALIYGPAYQPYDVLAALRQEGAVEAPFAREHDAMRLRWGVEHGVRLARRVRDELRAAKRTPAVGALLATTGPAATRLAQALDFAVISPPEPGRLGAMANYEVLRAALGSRGLVALVDDATSRQPGQVAQAARLAAAVRADVALPSSAPAASHAMLAAHRAFWRVFRAKYRPPQPFAEILVVYSPECDHLTKGVHGEGVRAVLAAFTLLGVQARVVLETPREGTEPLVLVDAAALPEAEMGRVERRVAEGASAILVGRCGVTDEVGRRFDGPFDELGDGLNKSGTGTVFGIDARGAGGRRADLLAPVIERAVESLLGRGRRVAGFGGAPLVVKLYLDPERKLDVHLVSRAVNAAGEAQPVRGASIYLSGLVASSARSAYLFKPGAPERRVPLTPFGMGVQATLPDFEAEAVLVIDR